MRFLWSCFFFFLSCSATGRNVWPYPLGKDLRLLSSCIPSSVLPVIGRDGYNVCYKVISTPAGFRRRFPYLPLCFPSLFFFLDFIFRSPYFPKGGKSCYLSFSHCRPQRDDPSSGHSVRLNPSMVMTFSPFLSRTCRVFSGIHRVRDFKWPPVFLLDPPGSGVRKRVPADRMESHPETFFVREDLPGIPHWYSFFPLPFLYPPFFFFRETTSCLHRTPLFPELSSGLGFFLSADPIWSPPDL